jgi:hypothetical protein
METTNDEYDIEDCPENEHDPDPFSVVSVENLPWVFDINCKLCGKSGSFRLQFNSTVYLQWD